MIYLTAELDEQESKQNGLLFQDLLQDRVVVYTLYALFCSI